MGQPDKVLLTRPSIHQNYLIVLLRPGFAFPGGNIMSLCTYRENVESYVQTAIAVQLDDYTQPIAQVIEEFDLGAHTPKELLAIAADRLEDIGGNEWVVSQWRRGRLTY